MAISPPSIAKQFKASLPSNRFILECRPIELGTDARQNGVEPESDSKQKHQFARQIGKTPTQPSCHPRRYVSRLCRLTTGQPVTDAGRREQPLGLRGIVFDFLSQLLHVDAKVLKLIHVRGSPDSAQ